MSIQDVANQVFRERLKADAPALIQSSHPEFTQEQYAYWLQLYDTMVDQTDFVRSPNWEQYRNDITTFTEAAIVLAAAIYVGGAAAGGAAGGAGAAGTAAGAGGGAAAGSAAGSAGAASAATSASNSSVVASISGFIAEIKSFVSNIVGPIRDTVSTISGFVKSINDGIIQPIVGTITQAQTAYQTLMTAVSRDLSSGIQGLARIPGDISNALGSVDASLQRAMTALGGVNVDIAKNILVAGLAAGIGAPVTALGSMFADSSEKYLSTANQHTITQFQSSTSMSELREKIIALETKLTTGTGWPATLANLFIDSFRIVAYHIALAKPLADAAIEDANRVMRVTSLDPSSAALAWRRGLITEELARSEIAAEGYSEARITALLELAATLPGAGDLVRWLRLGLIEPQQYSTLMAKLGFDEESAAHYLAGAYAPPGPGDIIAAEDRASCVDANVAATSLMSRAPATVTSVAASAGVSDIAVQTLWQNHWALFPPSLAVDAWFKGLITYDMVRALLRAASLPDELHQVYIDQQRPRIPARSIPSLFVAGVIDAGRAHDQMLQAGYRPEDVEMLIKYAEGKSDTPTAVTADALHGLTQSTILGLYDQGSIDRAAAEGLLVQVGIGSDAAHLSLQLRDLNRQVSERNAARDLILAQASVGGIGFDDAQTRLLALGLTTTETERAMTTLIRDAQKFDKLPSIGELTSMRKKDLIDNTVYLETLGYLGYSPTWAQRFLALITGGV